MITHREIATQVEACSDQVEGDELALALFETIEPATTLQRKATAMKRDREATVDNLETQVRKMLRGSNSVSSSSGWFNGASSCARS